MLQLIERAPGHPGHQKRRPRESGLLLNTSAEGRTALAEHQVRGAGRQGLQSEAHHGYQVQGLD